LERTYAQILRRRLILKALADDEDGRHGSLRLTDVATRVRDQAEDATLFTADQKIRMLAAAESPFRSGLATSWGKSAAYPVLPFTPPVAAACTPVSSASGTSTSTAGNINFLLANRNLSSGITRDDNGYLMQPMAALTWFN
jgi:hypothetical protein